MALINPRDSHPSPFLGTPTDSLIWSYENFRPTITLLEAKLALKDSPTYSHLLLPTTIHGKFLIAFVSSTGHLEHEFIKVIDAQKGIFLNGSPLHVGPLLKVIRDSMSCPPNTPLPQR